ncbi:MAG: extracellular solute-binding protein [Anaerolineae bacterium]
MKSRVLVLLLVAALTLPLAVASAQNNDVVTIKFWHTYNETSPENAMLVETLIPMFEAEHPNIKVESVPFPYDDFRQALVTSLAGGEGPDLARLDIIWSPEFAQLGALTALDEAMPDFDEFAERVFPGPLSTNFFEGHYYGLPLDTNTRVYLWNKTIYEQVGMEPPATIDDVRALCDVLPEDTYAFSDGGTYGWAVLPWIWSFGGSITDEDITQASGYVNGEATVAAYEFLHDMIDSGCFSPAMLGGGLDSGTGYYTNVNAAILGGPWMYAIAEAQYPDFEVNSVLMPAGEGGSVSVIGGENIVLFANSQHPEEALEFLRFTQSVDYQLKMSETAQITVLPELLESEFYQEHPYFGIYLEQLQTARARTPHPAWTQIEDVLSQAGQLILRGEMSAQEALDAAAEEIDALLAGE